MSLHDYAGMLFHSERILKFQRAIDEAVRPGDRVLEVGTGLGTYAFFAAMSGAEAVCAIDSDPIVHLAQDLSVSNGFDGRIQFLRGTAPRDLPAESFDLIIFEDFPTHLLGKDSFKLLRTLESVHLAEGGRLLPGAARLCLAPVLAAPPASGPESGLAEGLGVGPAGPGRGGEDFGLDWGELRSRLANTGRKDFLSVTSLAAPPHEGPPFALLPVPRGSDLEIRAEWSGIEGRIGGLALWFDLDLGDAGWVSNAPRENPEPWGQWVLPLDPPLPVEVGARLEARVWREELEDGAPGWMGWECTADGEVRRGHEFAGIPISPTDVGISAGPATGPAKRAAEP